MPPSCCFNLEAEANAKLSLERDSEWLRKTSGSKEVDWLTEIRLARHVLELVTKISSIEYIECLEEEAKLVILAPLEELRSAHVQL